MSQEKQEDEEQDPVDELDVGETVDITSESYQSFWGSSDSDQFVGFDREVSDLTLDEARLVGDDGNEEVYLSFSGEVTKVEIPEHVRERREASKQRRERNERVSRFSRVAAVLIPLAITLGVAYGVMMFMPSFEIAINEQATTFNPTLEDFVMTGGFIAAFTLFVAWGMSGGFPGTIGGGR